MNPTTYYFNHIYPSRKIGYLFGFRKKEDERLTIIIAFLKNLKIGSICDVGCGDGLFLKNLLQHIESPKHIRVEDISPKNIDNALQNLSHTKVITTSNINEYSMHTKGVKSDITLCIGVSDYYINWKILLENLINRTNNILIIDFPIHGKSRNRIRAVWLNIFNVTYKGIRKNELVLLVDSYHLKYTLYTTKYNWLVIIEKSFSNE